MLDENIRQILAFLCGCLICGGKLGDLFVCGIYNKVLAEASMIYYCMHLFS